jgi:predicted subunit of tRNA(5-methylaminomethyl-2-thiouridylate) methyltransferase
MDIFVLFSGGKDSSLSAILLEPFFDVTLATCNFGFVETWKPAAKVASELGFPHEVLRIDGAILESARDQPHPQMRAFVRGCWTWNHC